MIINKLIKEIVDRLNLSVDEISHKTGYTVEEIEAVLNDTAVSTKMAFNICRAIDVDLEDILKA